MELATVHLHVCHIHEIHCGCLYSTKQPNVYLLTVTVV